MLRSHHFITSRSPEEWNVTVSCCRVHRLSEVHSSPVATVLRPGPGAAETKDMIQCSALPSGSRGETVPAYTGWAVPSVRRTFTARATYLSFQFISCGSSRISISNQSMILSRNYGRRYAFAIVLWMEGQHLSGCLTVPPVDILVWPFHVHH